MINDTSTPMTSPRSFKVRYEMCTEGCNGFWGSHALIVDEANIDHAEIHNVEYIGDAPNGWPEIEVTFNCIETAKMYTAIYLGIDVADGWDVYADDEVMEYLAPGQFV